MDDNEAVTELITIADGRAVQRYGVHSAAQEQADVRRSGPGWPALAAKGEITIPIAAIYPLELVRDAYRDLATRHVSGKRVLAVKPLSGFEGDNR